VLPIIVAAFCNEGDIVLIENQRSICILLGRHSWGSYLTDVARAGVQVIVETTATISSTAFVARFGRESFLPDQVTIHFFGRALRRRLRYQSPVR